MPPKIVPIAKTSSSGPTRKTTTAGPFSRATRSSQNATSSMHSRKMSPVSALSQGLRSVRNSISSAELADDKAPWPGPAFHRCCECVYKFKSRSSWVKCVRCPEPSGWAHSLCAGFKSEAEAKRSDWVCGDCRASAASSLTAALASSPIAHTASRASTHQPAPSRIPALGGRRSVPILNLSDSSGPNDARDNAGHCSLPQERAQHEKQPNTHVQARSAPSNVSRQTLTPAPQVSPRSSSSSQFTSR